MDEKQVIILCVTALVCVAIFCGALLLTQDSDDSNNTTNATNNTTVANNTTLNQSNYTNNTTEVKKTSNSKSKSSTKKSSSSSNDGYRWSEQYGDYVKEYTDSNGVQHIDSKKGYRSSYNPKTNEFKEENYDRLS